LGAEGEGGKRLAEMGMPWLGKVTDLGEVMVVALIKMIKDR
jgi:hypothetical protein